MVLPLFLYLIVAGALSLYFLGFPASSEAVPLLLRELRENIRSYGTRPLQMDISMPAQDYYLTNMSNQPVSPNGK